MKELGTAVTTFCLLFEFGRDELFTAVVVSTKWVAMEYKNS